MYEFWPINWCWFEIQIALNFEPKLCLFPRVFAILRACFTSRIYLWVQLTLPHTNQTIRELIYAQKTLKIPQKLIFGGFKNHYILNIFTCMAKNSEQFGFWISFRFLAKTHTFLNGFANFKNLKCSELQYGSFAILHVKFGGVIRELWWFKVEVRCYVAGTVQCIRVQDTWVLYKAVRNTMFNVWPMWA